MKKKVIIPIIIVITIIIVLFAFMFIKKKKHILFIKYYLDYNYSTTEVAMHGLIYTDIQNMLMFHYKKKLSVRDYVWDKSDNDRFNKSKTKLSNNLNNNCYPVEPDLINACKEISDNKDILLLVSKARKTNPSFAIALDLKRMVNNAVELIFYVIDLQDGCQVFEIKTRIMDIENSNDVFTDLYGGKLEKIAKEIIQVIDENNSLLPW